MTFWQENYSFIREVYDTRYAKMVEWMDNVEMAIQKVCASKVYTSAEFKREKDNFQSLCKNLERAETKKWLNETLETLMKVSFEFIFIFGGTFELNFCYN